MRIAIVNDLRIATEALRRVVCSQRDYTVAWTAANGEEAVRLCRQDRPDVVLMDLLMPGMNGAEATREIMRHCPCPILVVTATVAGNYSLVCEAMSFGAFDAVATPVLDGSPPAQAGAAILAKLTNVDKIGSRHSSQSSAPDRLATHSPSRFTRDCPPFPIIAIGASTGGPQALRTVLSGLPSDLNAAIVIVQHISSDFADSLAVWLANNSKLCVRTVRDGDRPVAGTALIARTDDHLVIRPDGTLAYTRDPIENPFRPSVDVFFHSLASHWRRTSVAVLLTGIGRNGAQGLLELRRVGWHTIAQDQESCVVYGMPQAAFQVGAVMEVLSVEQIAGAIASQVRKSR